MPKVIANITMSLDGIVTREGAERGPTTTGSGAGMHLAPRSVKSARVDVALRRPVIP